MFFIRFLRFFLGTVRFTAKGGFPERFLNAAASAGLNLWGIRRGEDNLTACVRARDFDKLQSAAKKAHLTLVSEKKKGLPFYLFRYRRRVGAYVGLVVFLAAVAFFSCFVWTVDVSGTESQQLLNTLDGLGLRPGVFRLTLNLRDIEQKALLKLPDVAWLSINMKGSRAYVQYKERKYPPELVPYDKPCNVKASETGQITKLETYEGMALVRKGDAVKKGDVIASGIIEEKSGALRIVHARAKAIAVTSHELSAVSGYTETARKLTGQNTARKQLILFGLRVPLYWSAPRGNYITTVSEKDLSINGMKLAFGLKTISYKGYTTQKIKLNAQQAEQKARDSIAAKEKIEFSTVKILKRTYKVIKNADAVTVICGYSCEENIAYEEEFKIS